MHDPFVAEVGPPALSRMTPELAGEVRRNLIVVGGAATAGILLLSFFLAALVDPTMGHESQFVGLLLFLGLGGMAVSFGTALTILAYRLGCWPALLRAKTVERLYGVDRAELSNAAMRRAMRLRGYWLASARGILVGGAVGAVWFLMNWAVRPSRPPNGLIGPAVGLAVFAGGIAARAWVVRRAVEARVGSKGA